MTTAATEASGSFTVVYVEDDERLAQLTTRYLESHGVAVMHASNGPEGLRLALTGKADVVLLDLMLPGMDGMEVCQQLRTRSDVPIVMLTARDGEPDRVNGLEGGADDYVVKPFSSRELLARLRAQVRRFRSQSGPAPSTLQVGPLNLDAGSMTATLHGNALVLTTYEFGLLRALAERAGRVLSREQLIDMVRGSADEAFDRSIDVHISHLRQKLGDDPRNPTLLKTVRGVGYMLARSMT